MIEIADLQPGSSVHLPALTRPGCAIYTVVANSGLRVRAASGPVLATIYRHTEGAHRPQDCPAHPRLRVLS